jgi:putative ABC transport system permease protein
MEASRIATPASENLLILNILLLSFRPHRIHQPMIVSDIKLISKLTLLQMRHQAMRMLLTILATIAAACVVIWVVSGYDSLIHEFDEFSDVYLGRYDFVVIPYTVGQEGRGTGALNNKALNNRSNDVPVRFEADLLDELRSDPAIESIDPILQLPVRISRSGSLLDESDRLTRGPTEVGRNATSRTGNPAVEASNASGQRGAGTGRRGSSVPPMLVGTNASAPPYSLQSGLWFNPDRADSNEAVISSGYAKQLKVGFGDELDVRSSSREVLKLKIVGIVEQRKALPSPPQLPGTHPPRGAPLPRGPAVEAVYVPLAVAEKFAQSSGHFDLMGIVLNKGFKFEEFEKKWSSRLAHHSPIARLQSLKDIEQELADSVASETVRGQAWMATGISLLAALFIIFSTLSMGVEERIVQLAMLRAIALSKFQIAGMIVMESLLLGIIGWCGGMLTGWGLLTVLTRWRPELFPQGATIGFWSVALSGICAVGGALAASWLPAWRASRVKPLEAMIPRGTGPVTQLPWLVSIVGLVLVAANPVILFSVPMTDSARLTMATVVGFPSMCLGFILLAPAVIAITEGVLAHLVCKLFGTDPRLLETQLTSNLWRTLGTTVAMSLGLGLFNAMQIWGYSMLAPFVPGDWVPDAIVMMTPTGIPQSEIDTIRAVKGIDGSRSLACIAEQTKFASDVTGAETRATTSRQDNCIMAGVDPDLAIGGDKPVFDFRFIRGSRNDALMKLKQGRFCLVPDAFERESGLTVGDKFGVIPPNHPDQVVEYEIAGVVSMVGWHWMSKVGLRNRDGGRAAAMMITELEQIQKDMDVQRINAFWLNYDGTASEGEIKSSLEDIVERNFDAALIQSRNRLSEADGTATTVGSRQGKDQVREGYSSTVTLRSREETARSIKERAASVIWLISQLPLVTLLVTSLGVVNTIVASIRVRQWELGVLRSLGITRFGLFRMILCEAVLTGIAACLLSLAFGIVAGYCGTEISRYLNMRGGQITPLIIPWPQVLFGCAVAIGLCLVAALWPAIRTGSAEPLSLLKAGRASA